MAEVVEVLVPGGKATAGPPLGPSLGPLGINVKAVVDEINKKTATFNGMQVPVRIEVDAKKAFTVTVGIPPTTALIKKEANPAIGGPLTMPKEQAPAPVFQPLAPAAPMGAGFNRLKAMFARGR